MADVSSKLFEFSLKTGTDFLKSHDDIFEAAISIFGKSVVGSSLSRLSTFQCAGLVGLVVSTVAPQVVINYSAFH